MFCFALWSVVAVKNFTAKGAEVYAKHARMKKDQFLAVWSIGRKREKLLFTTLAKIATLRQRHF